MSTTAPLTMRDLLKQFLPLSLSDTIMILTVPVIVAGMTRLPDQAVHLAAFGVAQGMAILVESPIIMLLHASTALSRDRLAFGVLRRFMIGINLALTLIYALLAFTPLYDALFRGLLGQPAAVADAARPAFAVMLLWPAAIGWRRFYQGFLIARRRSGAVGKASFYRLLSLALTVIAGVLLRLPGALVGGLALVVSVLVEAAVVTYYARAPLRAEVWAEPAPGNPHQMLAMLRYYWPLGLTAFLIWFSKPAISGGLARAGEPELSLAAWPAAWMLLMLVGNMIRMIQQIVITQASSPENYRLLVRFTWWAGLLTSALMWLLAFTPAGVLLLTRVTGLAGNLAAVALPAMQLGVLFPLGIALQNHLQGLLIRAGRTGAVNLGALIGSGTLFLVMLAGVSAGWLGTVVGSVATMVGLLAEVLLLYGMTQQERAALRPAPQAA